MRKSLILFVYLVLAVIIYHTDNQALKVALFTFIVISSVLSKKVDQFWVFCSLTVVLSTFSSPILWLLPCIPLFLNTSIPSKLSKYIYFIIPFFGLAILSFIFGQDSELNTMLVLFVSILIFIQVLDANISTRELLYYSIFSLTLLVIVLILDSVNGGLLLKFGRLSIDGSIRTVANVAALPAFLSWSLFLSKDNSVNRILLIIIGLVSSTILLLTISKGAIIAVVLGVLISSFTSFNKKSILLMIIMVLILSFFFNRYVLTLEDYHFFRLSEEFNGLSGRTDIWSIFLNKFTESSSTVLLGFGPGDIKRFAYADDSYAHSLFFDLLLSYGVLMSLLYVIVLIRMAIKIFKSKNSMALGLIVFSVLLFATHGVVTNTTFYIYIGTAYSLCVKSKRRFVSRN